MMTLLLAFAAGTSAPVDVAPHRVAIDHRGAPVTLVYDADVRVKTRDIGAATPNRPDSRRCLWNVQLVAARHVEAERAAQPALRHAFEAEKVAEGSRHGTCMMNRAAIAADVAAKQTKIQGQLQALADRDRSVVLAELDTARAFASN